MLIMVYFHSGKPWDSNCKLSVLVYWHEQGNRKSDCLNELFITLWEDSLLAVMASKNCYLKPQVLLNLLATDLYEDHRLAEEQMKNLSLSFRIVRKQYYDKLLFLIVKRKSLCYLSSCLPYCPLLNSSHLFYLWCTYCNFLLWKLSKRQKTWKDGTECVCVMCFGGTIWKLQALWHATSKML